MSKYSPIPYLFLNIKFNKLDHKIFNENIKPLKLFWVNIFRTGINIEKLNNKEIIASITSRTNSKYFANYL